MELAMKPIVLVADGDSQLRELYEMYLGECGYEVETAADGLECVAKLRQMKPAALLLDLQLPWGGGDGVVDWLRQESSTFGAPVVLTSTLHYGQEVTQGVQPPVVRILAKPFTLTALLESLSAALSICEHEEPLIRTA
jgi:CheY-like chemotaxis protein